ncbi:MAG: EAL domain-containing protein, partial [Gammaproteobacteria bacterium]|nr:EAL domain-containing protein [Gammaproteobacteria bacterium]
GVQLSIDDFGTGESAIAYLKELPVDTLKIDRSYIHGLLAEVRDTAMTSAMIALAQKLELSVVAEGVETTEQLAMIRSFGCDQYQGFLESPPVGAEELLALLSRR